MSWELQGRSHTSICVWNLDPKLGRELSSSRCWSIGRATLSGSVNSLNSVDDRLVWDMLSRRGRPLIGDSKEAFAIAEAIDLLIDGVLAVGLVGRLLAWLGSALLGFVRLLKLFRERPVCVWP